MIFGIQMYHEEKQVNFEYGCDPIIIKGIIALGLKKLLENEFLFIFLIDGRIYWIQHVRPSVFCFPNIFWINFSDIEMKLGMIVYNDELQINFEFCCY
jgi:hypothetical protein